MLSYSVIKSNDSLNKDKKVIETNYERDSKFKLKCNDDEKIDIKREEDIILSYKEMAKSILEDARKRKDKILLDATEESRIIQREAYEKAYEEGLNNAMEDSFKESEKIIKNAKYEAEEILETARNILRKSKNEYDNYLLEKREEIINLSLNIAEKILNNKIDMDSGILSIVEKAIENTKDEKSLIIRANKNDIYKIENHIKNEGFKLGFGKEISLFEDNISEGNLIIEKGSGIIEAGVDIGLQKIGESIRGSLC